VLVGGALQKMKKGKAPDSDTDRLLRKLLNGLKRADLDVKSAKTPEQRKIAQAELGRCDRLWQKTVRKASAEAISAARDGLRRG